VNLITASALDRARALRALGLSVIPVHAPGAGQDGKRPAVAWKPYQERLATEDELVAWFGREGATSNLAIITGAVSGVVVVDADSPEAETWVEQHLPKTPWRVRTGKGTHYFYAHPGGTVPNKAKIQTPDGKLALDLRGDGGYVIGPGSRHASGVYYTPSPEFGEAPLPSIDPDLWRPRQGLGEAPPPGIEDEGALVARARAYLARIPRPEIGDGSDPTTFYAACRVVRGFGLPEGAAAAVLWDWAGNRPGWTLEWVHDKVRNAWKYGREPEGGLRDQERRSRSTEAASTPDGSAAPEPGSSGKVRFYIEPAREFLAEEDPPLQFVVGGLISAQSLALLHGEPRARKSWAALEIAVATATGTPAFGLEAFQVPAAAPVLYSSQEDPRARVRDRARRFLRGRALDPVYPETLFFSVHANINLEDEAWQAALLRDVKAFGLGLVIFDPIRRYSPNVDKGPAEVRALSWFLRPLATETGCSVLIVHHDVKPARDSADNRRRGHRASGGDWFAASDCPIACEPAGPNRTLVVGEDFKFAEDPAPFIFGITEDEGKTWVRLVGEGVEGSQAAEVVLEERILDYLRHSPGASTISVVKNVQTRKERVQEALARLEQGGKVDAFQRGRAVLWFLRPQGAAQ